MFGNPINKVNRAIEKNNEQTLLKLANDKKKEVQLAAIKGLGTVAGDDSNNFFSFFLRSADADIREASATALGNQGYSHAHEFLSHQLKNEKDKKVAAALSEAMKKLSPLKD